MKYILLCLLNVALLVTGQTLFRHGVSNQTFGSVFEIIKIMFSPFVFAGLVLYALTTLLWLYILSVMPLSRAYPIQALAFPTVLIISKLLFGEDVSLMRWGGAAVIFIGVVMIAQS